MCRAGEQLFPEGSIHLAFPPSSQQTPTSQNNKLVGKASDHVQAPFSEQCAGLLTQPKESLLC